MTFDLGEKQAYDVLRANGRFGDDAGLTMSAIESRCDEIYGKKCGGYWKKQITALRDMGFARLSGRVEHCGHQRKPVWVACDPWGEE
jgi:hypothetical protein